MTMPTAPTAISIVTEALTRFLNGSEPDSDEVTRAIDYGLEKVKRDIMGLGKMWKPLIETTYQITKAGVSHYDNPTDFEKDLSVGLMSGTHTGALINVDSSSTVTLAATENALQRECEGKMLLITSGNGVNQAQVIDDYVFATKIATLAAAFTVTPNVLDGYMVVDSIKDLIETKIERYDQFQYPGIPGAPVRFVPIPNDTAGKIALHPVPDAVYGIQRRYFIDLMKLDTASTRYTTILRRWAGIFEQGVYVWKLGEDDDRYETENQNYQNMLITLMAHDLYGFDPVKAGLQKGEG
jgi:hypothetical protein